MPMWYMAQDRLAWWDKFSHPAIRPVYTIGLDTWWYDVNKAANNWYRIANELLSRADITINGSAPSDIRVKNPDFFKRVLQEGS
ncbi:hypothetical protein MJN54_33865, partial [Salmonella enterica subsp. enterica serovar Kentucky]|nr:hypothetical protein [Salmonella enterica subsp. enterica serovar Kentucky]